MVIRISRINRKTVKGKYTKIEPGSEFNYGSLKYINQNKFPVYVNIFEGIDIIKNCSCENPCAEK